MSIELRTESPQARQAFLDHCENGRDYLVLKHNGSLKLNLHIYKGNGLFSKISYLFRKLFQSNVTEMSLTAKNGDKINFLIKIHKHNISKALFAQFFPTIDQSAIASS